jgi:UDP-N-acetylmuramate--alanine ligase
VSVVNNIQRVYFIGIGGIGMSAIARYFHTQGVRVSGYDKTSTPLTKSLEESGIIVYYDENAERAPKDVDVVIYTPAIPKEHKELVYYQQNNFNVVKRSDVLKLITEMSFNICVAGTHGKTTITTMIAHLLRDTGFGCNAFLGGIAANYNTNFWSDPNNVCVVEADEYDRSFLKLSPNIAVVSAMDPDHLDIYGTPVEVENAFIEFSGKLKPGGTLIAKHGLKRGAELHGETKLTYAYNNLEADVHARNLRVENGSYTFDVHGKDWAIKNVLLHMGGLHNVENCIAAITVAKTLNIDDDKIKSAVAAFKGVHRRFEYVVKSDEHVLIDDYAHHPEELRALITGVQSIFKNEKCTVVFQPHLFSRTNDLADGFAEALDLADEVILLPIYPARELPMVGVTSNMIASKMKKMNIVMSKEEMLQWVSTKNPKLLVMAGAGDIDALVKPVADIMNS